MDAPDRESSETSVVLTEAPADEGLCLNRLIANVDVLEYTTYDAFKRDCNEVSHTTIVCTLGFSHIFAHRFLRAFNRAARPTRWSGTPWSSYRCAN